MKPYLRRHVKIPFQRAFIELPWFGPVVSALLVTMVVDLLTQAVTTSGGLWLGWAVVLALTAATFAFVYLYTLGESRRRVRGVGFIADLPHPPKGRGLIFMFSREATLREAIAYHAPELTHCWLLVTPQMRDRASRAVNQFPDVKFTPYPLADPYDSQGCYQTVMRIYREEARERGLDPDEVIADITGGTKPMTLGMILACLDGDYAMEHVPTAFDGTGQPTGPLPPIQIRVRRRAEENEGFTAD